MDGRELIQKTIGFKQPERLALAKGPDSDIAYISYRNPSDFRGGDGIDEWGCGWKSLNPDMNDQGQVVSFPLIRESRIQAYSFPDPYADGRFDHVPEEMHKAREKGQFVCGSIGAGPMHRLEYLRGFENFLTDFHLHPEWTEFLMDGIFAFLEGLTLQFAEFGADGIFLIDDQAIQTGPLFSMDVWRKFFKPRYEQLFGLAHEKGLKVYMHACGNLSEHLEDLVSVGVDILDNKQPSLWMDCPAVGRVKGKICFSTCIDIQSTIHTIGIDEIETEVHRLVRRLGTSDGGFIGTYYHQPDLHLPEEKISKMVDAFRAYKHNSQTYSL
jgi:uroporphyrinogen decarboxylase